MDRVSKIISILLFAAILAYAAHISSSLNSRLLEKRSFKGDINAIWLEGQRICNLENPYSRIHKKGMKINKPPTYLPGFYIFVCGCNKAGFVSYRDWLGIWSKVNMLLYLLTGAVFFYACFREKAFYTGLALASLFYFNRWSMHTLTSFQHNFAGILPLVLSLIFFEKKKKLSLFLFSLSLLFKQVAIFLIPVYLLAGKEKIGLKNTAVRLILITAIPLLISLPFIIDDLKGFVFSIFYSALRPAEGRGLNLMEASGYSRSMMSASMYLSMFFIFISTGLKKVSLTQGAALIMLLFIGLNPVFFSQYFLWALCVTLTVFIPKSTYS